MSDKNDSELPEWYRMLKRVFVELNAYDQDFYRTMGAGNALAQARYAALREMSYEKLLDEPEKKNNVDESIWCQVCQCWQRQSGLVRWTGDDALHFLCPGCDGDMLPVQSMK